MRAGAKIGYNSVVNSLVSGRYNGGRDGKGREAMRKGKSVRKYGRLTRCRQYFRYGAHVSLLLPMFMLLVGGAMLGFFGAIFSLLGLVVSILAAVSSKGAEGFLFSLV